MVTAVDECRDVATYAERSSAFAVVVDHNVLALPGRFFSKKNSGETNTNRHVSSPTERPKVEWRAPPQTLPVPPDCGSVDITERMGNRGGSPTL